MQEELDSIHSNHTWSLVSLPPNTKAITSRWVFIIKTGTNGHQACFKARLVARGFEQTDGVDFLETFAPIVPWETIRILIAIAAHLNWSIHQLDVLTAFLNGILKEDVYMFQLPSFIQPGTEHLVCKLHKFSLWPQTESSSLVCSTSLCSPPLRNLSNRTLTRTSTLLTLEKIPLRSWFMWMTFFSREATLGFLLN